MAPRGRQRSKDAVRPAFPTQQLFILALCRICEPIAFMSVFPYTYYMIQSFDITTDERQIAIYCGMVTSAFAFAEFSTGVVWGKLSDKVGRKPILIGGLIGTAISMMVFGFATSLPVALLGRALGGLLNGNIGVLQTTVAELVTVKEHQPRAYTVMPTIWCLGSILGPALGGLLAQPCLSYPSIFPRGTIFDQYPFLLPNLVCTAVLVCGITIGILFLEETHEMKKLQRDVGLEAGKRLLTRIRGTPLNPMILEKMGGLNEEVEPFLDDEQLPGYRSTEGSPHRHSHPPASRVRSLGPNKWDSKVEAISVKRQAIGVPKAFTKQVILNIIGYGILAYHTISYEQLMPVFLSTPVSHDPPTLPFKFVGGFALTSKVIGFIMSLQGIYALAAQLFLFPFLASRCGSLRVFQFVVISWPMLYFTIPYLVLLPTRLQMPSILICLFWKTTSQVLAYPANAILLTNSAPSMLVLGAINGVAASTASLCRAFGPTVSGLIHSWGLKLGYTGLAWWASGLICVLGGVESLWMEESGGRMSRQEPSDEESNVDGSVFEPLVVNNSVTAAGGSADTRAEEVLPGTR